MSLLNQLFNRGVFAAKCKTSLNLAISRIKLLQNKRDVHLKHMRKEISQFLQAGQEAIARIRVEHVIREQNIRAAFEILELFCEFVLARVPVLEVQKEFPTELREAVASIIFAAPRCLEVPDLLQIKNLFATKYGKEFVMAASELRPDSGVNRALIERLSVSTPPPEARLNVLKEIAEEHNVVWDSSNTEAELSKKHEDLLAGSKQAVAEAALSKAPIKHSLPKSPSNGPPPLITGRKHESKDQAPSSISISEIEPSSLNPKSEVTDVKQEPVSRSSDVLEKARAAIAAAERATAAARAASELVNTNFNSLKLEGKSS